MTRKQKQLIGGFIVFITLSFVGLWYLYYLNFVKPESLSNILKPISLPEGRMPIQMLDIGENYFVVRVSEKTDNKIHYSLLLFSDNGVLLDSFGAGEIAYLHENYENQFNTRGAVGAHRSFKVENNKIVEVIPRLPQRKIEFIQPKAYDLQGHLPDNVSGRIHCFTIDIATGGCLIYWETIKIDGKNYLLSENISNWEKLSDKTAAVILIDKVAKKNTLCLLRD